MTYYNTNKEKGKTIIKSRSKAKTQEELILQIFQNERNLSASQAWAIYEIHHKPTPLTSIRRAITNLCKSRNLVKTNNMVMGIYGKQEHIYTLVKL